MHSGKWGLSGETIGLFVVFLWDFLLSCPPSNTIMHCEKLKCDIVYSNGRKKSYFFFDTTRSLKFLFSKTKCSILNKISLKILSNTITAYIYRSLLIISPKISSGADLEVPHINTEKSVLYYIYFYSAEKGYQLFTEIHYI